MGYVYHPNITDQAQLHIPKDHATRHQTGGADEIDWEQLTGLKVYIDSQIAGENHWNREGTYLTPTVANSGINVKGAKIINVPDPTSGSDVANKTYVDKATVAELYWDRPSGSTEISPLTPNDDLNMGSGKITCGSIDCEGQAEVGSAFTGDWSESALLFDSTFSCLNGSLCSVFRLNATVNMDCSTLETYSVIYDTSTITATASGGLGNSCQLFLVSSTISSATVGVPPPAFTPFFSLATVQGDGAVVGNTNANVFYDSTLYKTLNSGTMTVAAANTVSSQPRISAAAGSSTTVTLSTGLKVLDVTLVGSGGTETCTTRVGVDIADMTSATNSYGIRSAMTTGGGANLFINHTGTAASLHTGAFTVSGVINANGNITSDDVTDTAWGIQNQNLLDKVATEAITGEYTFENANTYVEGDLTIGTESDSDAFDEYWDNTAVAYCVGWDSSANFFKICGATFADATTDLIVIDKANAVIKFLPNYTSQVEIIDGVLQPTTTNDVDLGTTSLEFKNLYLAGTIDLGTNTITDGTMAGNWAFGGGNFSGVGTIGSGAITSTGIILGLRAVTTKYVSYTATTSDDIILCDATGTEFTITLPSASAETGRVFLIKKIDSTDNVVSIHADASGEMIDGLWSQDLTSQYDSVPVVSDGSNWHIL